MNAKRFVQVLLTIIVMSGVAAAPSSADWEWVVEGPFEGTGQITADAGGLKTGPGTLALEGKLFNANGMASGTVERAELLGTLNTNLPNCHAYGTAANLPWGLTVTTPDTVDITGVTLTFHYTTVSTGAPGCAAFGVPSTVSIKGTITGTDTNPEEETCFALNEYIDDMVVEGTSTPADLTSVEDICLFNAELE